MSRFLAKFDGGWDFKDTPILSPKRPLSKASVRRGETNPWNYTSLPDINGFRIIQQVQSPKHE